jgi:hypothetical protein
MDTSVNVEPDKEPLAEQVSDSDKVKGDCGKGKTSSVNERDWWDKEDAKINIPCVKTQTKERAKDATEQANTPPLKSAEEGHVIALNKSGSSALCKQHSLVNTADTSNSALYPIHGDASRSSIRSSSVKTQTPSLLLDAAKMTNLGSRISAMAVEGDGGFSVVGSRPKDPVGKLSTAAIVISGSDPRRR